MTEMLYCTDCTVLYCTALRYDGHAWASGIFAFADGKNQESTSESVNGWWEPSQYDVLLTCAI